MGGAWFLLSKSDDALLEKQHKEAVNLLIDKGACPFEGCVYREWFSRESVVVYQDKSTDSPIVTVIPPNSHIKAITGEVHVKPGEFIFEKPYTSDFSKVSYQTGDKILVYTYRGEGVFKISFHGKYYEENFMNDDMWRDFEGRESTWWVFIETQDGTRGWVDNSNNKFSNTDLSG